MKSLFAIPVLVFTLSAPHAVAANYHVTGKIVIGGEGGWDYLLADAEGRRVYVSHATKVVVADLDSGKVVGEIADTQGVHGIAIASKLNRGFTSNGRSNDVTIFDLKTLAPIGRIKTGENPDCIIFEPQTGRVFTFNGKSHDSTVIDAASGKVLGTIPLAGKPEFATVDGKGHIWVNIEDTHQITEIDAAAMKAIHTFTLEGCEEPSGMAIDPKEMRLFSVCDNKVMVISDAKANKVITTVPIGEGADGVAFDPGTGLAFSSNGHDGTLTVVSTKGGKFTPTTVTTQAGARTITIDTKTHKIYLPTADFAAPPAAAGQKAGRPRIVPGSFRLLIVSE
ncbi:MAG TPA: YncE family protein [Bryobacteraceae bacterium]|jgi:DNA-binding beta-propeller fold protein YncE